jgi:PadR family transcriptional regulator PadR
VQSLGFAGSDPGGLYRALRALEEEKLVRSVWEPSETGPDRRTYEITRGGMEELHRSSKAIAAGQDAVASFLSRYEEFVTLPRSGDSSRRANAPAR